ncbi:hypothetical protein OAG68_01045 [bacterium]|nr:hypothetical protein [bacterium]
MRAGAFADLRVIQLINRRFVPFYFNTGGPGLGLDSGASKFVQSLETDCTLYPDLKVIVDPRKRQSNTIAYFAAFSTEADGKVLGVADGWTNEDEANDLEKLYPGKDAVFQFLLRLLEDNPQLNKLTEIEEQTFATANAEPTNSTAQLQAAKIYEELGQYAKAKHHLHKTLGLTSSPAAPDPTQQATAFRRLLRIARYEKEWDVQRELLKQIKQVEWEQEAAINADIAMEVAYRMLEDGNYKELSNHLTNAIERFPKSSRLGELRYYAGVASFFLEDKPTAYFHWCWIAENIPDDRLARRAYISAAHESFPYPNFELAGFRSKNSVGNHSIQAAYDKAKTHYDRQMNLKN